MPEVSGNYLDFSADSWALVDGNYLLLDDESVIIWGDYLIFDISPDNYTGAPTIEVDLKPKAYADIELGSISEVAPQSVVQEVYEYNGEVYFAETVAWATVSGADILIDVSGSGGRAYLDGLDELQVILDTAPDSYLGYNGPKSIEVAIKGKPCALVEILLPPRITATVKSKSLASVGLKG